MKIGYACTPLMVPYKTTRRLTLSNYSEAKIALLIKDNLEDLYSILHYNNSKNIKLFRISSDIIPLGSHKINNYNWWDNNKELLNKIGDYIKSNNMRVSMHPGQYTLLNSPKKDVVEKSILDLSFHCKFLDALNLPASHKIILHVGGVYNNKKSAINRFVTEYNNLDNSIKKRLIIENDERFFSIYDLLEINSRCNIPIIFDNLHYECYRDTSISIPKLLPIIKETWKESDGDMKVHYSIQDTTKKRGAHSPTIFIDTFLDYLKCYDFSNIDIMLEVKDKEVSTIKTINSVNFLKNNFSHINFSSEIEAYKLFVLEKLDYDGLSKLKDIESQNNFIKLYNFIDSLIYEKYNEISFRRALNQSFESIRNELNSKEINHYNKNYKEQSYLKCKEYLKKISDKYNLPLNNTYYFIY